MPVRFVRSLSGLADNELFFSKLENNWAYMSK